MPLKLKLDSLRCDLASVEALLREAKEIGDPVGKLQYDYRHKQLEEELLKLEQTPEHTASVALFFGGKPVIGSMGIKANFAGSILEKFQELVKKQFANTETGSLGERGPVPFSGNTELMVTELARGSFGFVLEELADQQNLCATSLKTVVDQVADIVFHTATSNDEDFEKITENLDHRSLITLKSFFQKLDKDGATLRLVEGQRDFLLNNEAVHRGRLRTEATEIDEDSEERTGELLGFLPEHRRFELKEATGETISGSASIEATKQYLAALHSDVFAPGNIWKTSMNVRTIHQFNRPPKIVYKLLEFVRQVVEKP